MRLAAALLCITALAVGAAPAGAAPKKKQAPCAAMLTDPRGDTTLRDAPGTGAYDIVRGDLGFTRAEVVAVLQLANPSDRSALVGTAAQEWSMGAVVRGVRYEFFVAIDATGAMRGGVTAGGAGIPAATAEIAANGIVVWRFKQDPKHRLALAMVSEMDAATKATVQMDTAHAKPVKRSCAAK